MIRAVLALLLLSGCATAPLPDPKVVYRDVPIPVATACKPDPAPHKPDFADSDAAMKQALNVAEKARLRRIGELQWQGYAGELEAALLACEGP